MRSPLAVVLLAATLSLPGVAAAGSRLDRAQDAFDHGDYETAWELASKRMDKDKSGRALELSLLSLLAMAQPQVEALDGELIDLQDSELLQAINVLRLALAERSPDHPLVALAADLVAQATEPGVELLPYEPPDCPPEATAALERAEAAFGVGDWSQAVVEYRASAASCPDDARVWLYAGDAAAMTGATREDVFALYDRALALDPCWAMAWRFRADVTLWPQLPGSPPDRADAVLSALTSVACDPSYSPGRATLASLTGRPGATFHTFSRMEPDAYAQLLVLEVDAPGDTPLARRMSALQVLAATQPSPLFGLLASTADQPAHAAVVAWETLDERVAPEFRTLRDLHREDLTAWVFATRIKAPDATEAE